MTARETKAHADMKAAKPIASGGDWPDGDPQAAEIAARHRQQAEAFGTALEPVKPQTPREAIEAYLATLPLEQRVRVTLADEPDGGVRIAIDGGHKYMMWHTRSTSTDDEACAFIDRALAKPAPQVTRAPEAIEAERLIGGDDVERLYRQYAPEAIEGHRLTVIDERDAARAECDELRAQLKWRVKTIANKQADVDILAAQLATVMLERDRLLSLTIPEKDRTFALVAVELDEARETIARLTSDCESLRDYADRCSFASGVYYECDAPARGPIDDVERAIRDTARECDDLRSQLATVTQERDELCEQLGEAVIQSEERLAHAHQLQADIEEEQRGRLLLRERFGARSHETFGMFIERAIKERDTVTQERDALAVGVEVATQALKDLAHGPRKEKP
jgi:hypothetical protein